MRSHSLCCTLLLLLCAAALVLLSACGEPAADVSPASPVASYSTSDSPSDSFGETAEPSADPRLTPSPSASASDDPVVPLREAVDDDWFSNTAMIGHSLMEGMRLNSGLDTSDYYTQVGASVRSLLDSDRVTLPDGSFGRLDSALQGKSYEHVYLFMGINEVTGVLSALKSDYLELIDLVRTYSPEADIYVLAVLPVTRDKTEEGAITPEAIVAYNEMLQELCAEQGCWYVDVYGFYADKDGCLPSSASSDGIHLYAREYPELLRYIKRHTVGD